MSGTIVADSGNIGGFKITETEISASDGGLVLKSSGQITASAVSMSGTIVADSGRIGGFTITQTAISSSNLILSSSTGTGFLISASNFNVKADGNVTMSGELSASTGHIGGFTIKEHTLTSTTDEITAVGIQDATQTQAFFAGSTTPDAAEFRVSHAGELVATNVDLRGAIVATSIQADSGSIGGFTIGADALGASNFHISASTREISIGNLADPDDTDSASTLGAIFNGSTGKHLIKGAADAFIRVAPADLEIQTPKLFMGGANTFVSASNSKIEISSSNFHLETNGDLTASSVLFDGGRIGGFQIQEESILATNSAGNTILQINSSTNPFMFLGDAAGGLNHNVISLNPSFGIHAGALAFASAKFSVNMSGSIKATAGQIGGFGLGATTISSSNNNLILKSSGQITASAVSMSGTITADSGLIGGFKITETEISASSGGILFKSSGQITASNAQISGNITATSGVFSGSLSASAGTIGKFNIDNKLSSGTDIVLDPSAGGRITLNNKSNALSSTKGIFIGSSSINNIKDEYVIALGDTSTNDGGLFAIAGPSSDYVYIGEFGQANSSNNDITQMSGSFISYKSSNQSIAISSKNFKIDETGDIQISSSGDSAQILLDVDANKSQGIEINSDKGIFGYGDKDGASKRLETHGGMFKFTAAPVSIEGGLGGQGWPTDDTSDEPPVTFGDNTGNEVEPGGGYSGT